MTTQKSMVFSAVVEAACCSYAQVSYLHQDRKKLILFSNMYQISPLSHHHVFVDVMDDGTPVKEPVLNFHVLDVFTHHKLLFLVRIGYWPKYSSASGESCVSRPGGLHRHQHLQTPACCPSTPFCCHFHFATELQQVPVCISLTHSRSILQLNYFRLHELRCFHIFSTMLHQFAFEFCRKTIIWLHHVWGKRLDH